MTVNFDSDKTADAKKTPGTRRRKTLLLGILALLLALCCAAQAIAWVVANRRTAANRMLVYLDMPRGVYATSHPNVPATLSSDDMESYDFAASVGLDSDRILNPVSTPDTEIWFVPNDVLIDGTVNTNYDGDWFFQIDSEQADEYIIDQTFYMVNTYTADVTLRLSNVIIARGTAASDSDIYRSVRIAVTCGDDVTIYRVTEGTDNYGAAYPVSGANAVLTSDPSIPAGTQTAGQNDVTVLLPAAVQDEEHSAENMTLTTASVNIKVWIEGQNAYAVSQNAGYAFRTSLVFSQSAS